MARFEVPDGWMVQAFRFTLDPTAEQARSLARHFGARGKAYNWTVATLKADIQAWHASGIETDKPSLRVLRKRWNTVKDEICVNNETRQPWWQECSKEAYADGIRGAVDAYWNWQTSRAGKRAGRRVGYPRFKRKGRDADRVCFTTGAMRVEPDRRHLTLPVIGCVRTHENTRRIARLIRAGRARVLAISVRRNGVRLDATVRVLVQRPSSPTWRGLIRGWVSMSGFAAWRLSQPLTAQCSNKCRIRGHSTRHSKSCGMSAGHGRVARKAHGATVSAPSRFPGCIAGSMTSALITCTS
jgi:putative transposase